MADGALDLPGVDDAFPLSSTQAGMLFHSLSEPGTGVYLGVFEALLAADVDLAAFRAAWGDVVARHQALRSLIVWEGLDEPLQVVRGTVDPRFEDEPLDPADEAGTWRSRLEAMTRDGLDLAVAPVMRLALGRRPDGRVRFGWICHHALVDDWSAAIVLDDVAHAYAARRTGRPPALGADPRDAGAFADWLAARDADAADAFWREALSGIDGPTFLSTRRAEGGVQSADAPLVDDAELDPAGSAALIAAARDVGVTLGAFVAAVWGVVVSRLSGREDALFGLAATQRPESLAGVDRAVGNYVVTTPARTNIAAHASLRALIRARHADALAAREHASIPLGRLNAHAGHPEGEPLFDTILAFNRDHLAALGSPDASPLFEQVAARMRSSFPLALIITPGDAPSAPLRLRTVVDGVKHAPETGSLALSMMTAALRAAPDALDAPPGELPVMGHQALARAIGGEAGPDLPVAPSGEDTVVGAILARASEAPDAMAVSCGAARLTYGALDARSAALAHALEARGERPGDRVAVCLSPGPDLCIAVLAAMRAGCAYVPLDARYPSARLTAMLEASGAAAILTSAADVHALPENRRGDAIHVETASSSPPRPIDRTNPSLPAYVIFTSGSTGAPKGVVVSHRALAASTAAREIWYGERPEAFLLLSSVSFDSSIVGLFWTLVTGGRLAFPPPDAEKDPAAIADALAAEKVSHTLCLPSVHALVCDRLSGRAPPSLRTVIAAGEPLPRGLAEHHARTLPTIRLVNEYGPTEAAVWATAHDVSADQRAVPPPTGRVPIGRAIPGARIVLRDRCGRPVPDGLPGELLIGGAGLADGYLDRPEATAVAFPPDPDAPGERLYRTRDLAVRRPDGALELLGRIDAQVKIRGHRVEPAEVEAALERLHGVRDAAVVARSKGGRTDLVAFIAPTPGEAPTRETLRALARGEMPDWMVPSRFALLPALPRLPNGKVDRGGLSSLDDDAGPETEIIAPRSELEGTLARLWREALWLDRDIGVTEDFFELGGHSLLAMRLVSDIEAKTGLRLPVSALRRFTTVEDQAAALAGQPCLASPGVEPVADLAAPHAADEDPLDQETLRGLHAFSAGWPGEALRDGGLMRVLNRDGSRPPVFGWFNDAREFEQAGRHLGADQPLLGFRTGVLVSDLAGMSLSDQLDFHRRVARRHLQEVLEAQPDGAYVLVGMCQGSVIALDIALELQARRKPVAGVIVIETTPPIDFSGHVSIIYARGGSLNAYERFSRPEIAWNRRWGSWTLDMIDGDYGRLFEEPYIRPLIEAMSRRIEEARARPPLPLPPEGYAVAWEGSPPPLAPYVAGESRIIEVAARNASPHAWAASAEGGVRLACRWMRPDGSSALEKAGAADFETCWPPGEIRTFMLIATAPAAPGDYVLEIDMIEEDALRFADVGRGAAPLRLPTQVQAGAAAATPEPRFDAPAEPLGRPVSAPASADPDAATHADAVWTLGDYDAALLAYEALREQAPETLHRLAVCRLRRGDLPGAARAAREAMVMGEANADLWAVIAESHDRRGRQLRAWLAYRRSLAMQELPARRERLEYLGKRLNWPRRIRLRLGRDFRRLRGRS